MRGNETYWPKDFGTVTAPWHQNSIWRSTVPPSMYILVIEVHSPVNILVRDSLNCSVGTDENGGIKTEISGAIYTGPETEPEVVLIDNPYGKYEVLVYGVENGTFDFLAFFYSNRSKMTIEEVADVSIEKNEMKNYIVPEFPSSVFLLFLVLSVITVMLPVTRRREFQARGKLPHMRFKVARAR